MTTRTKGTWLILGASSGLARAFAHKAAAEGCGIILAGRDTDDLAATATDLAVRYSVRAEVLAYDALNPQAPQQLLEAARQAEGPVSVYVATAIMPPDPLMRVDPQLCAQMLATNLSSVVLALNALVPHFEAQHAGEIIILGSVAGDRGRKKNHLYGTTKAGLAAYAEGLGAYLSDYAVPVLLVKPGVMDTSMTWGEKNPPVPLGSPNGLAKACWKKRRTGGTLYFPVFWWPVMLLIRFLPRFIFNRMNF